MNDYINIADNCLSSKSKTIAENTRLSNNLLSQFDLVFLILDKPEEDSDKHYSELIMMVNL
jgi:DNA replicative helicase MCM subunit Mcm2 (Cdc46/Mcm family)